MTESRSPLPVDPDVMPGYDQWQHAPSCGVYPVRYVPPLQSVARPAHPCTCGLTSLTDASRHGKVVVDQGEVVGVLQPRVEVLPSGVLYELDEGEEPDPGDEVLHRVRPLPDPKEERNG